MSFLFYFKECLGSEVPTSVRPLTDHTYTITNRDHKNKHNDKSPSDAFQTFAPIKYMIIYSMHGILDIYVSNIFQNTCTSP